MKPQDLLKPRYKVINNYPNSVFPIGEIIQLERGHQKDWHFIHDGQKISEQYISAYPHLFKKLQWWEDRELPQMPGYIKKKDGQVIKVEEWSWDYFDKDKYPDTKLMCFRIPGDDHSYYEFENFLPATEEEYNNPKAKAMTQIEGNKIIAEFDLGVTQQDIEWLRLRPASYFEETRCYHKSWDLLMPVVEKIEDIEFEEFKCIAVSIECDECEIKDYRKGRNSFVYHNGKSKIDAVWQAVIEFIKWYNEYNNQPSLQTDKNKEIWD